MYKVLNDHAAPSLKESFYERNVLQNRYNLRNSEYDLTIPRVSKEKLSDYLRRSFNYSGAMLWNDLSFAANRQAVSIVSKESKILCHTFYFCK